jgi:hypothetical protein
LRLDPKGKSAVRAAHSPKTYRDKSPHDGDGESCFHLLGRRQNGDAELCHPTFGGDLDYVSDANLVSDGEQNIAGYIMARLFEALAVLGRIACKNALA